MAEADKINWEQALAQCAAEPIHTPGRIQSHGALLTLDDTLVVRQASANLGEFFDVTATAAIGKPFASLVGREAARKVAGARVKDDRHPMVLLPFAGKRGGTEIPLDGLVHFIDGLYVIDLTRSSLSDRRDVYQRLFLPIRDTLWKMDGITDLADYTREVCEQIRLLTGFERVMVYRFEANWDGEVIAESRDKALAPYLGQRFPASDIPPQARALYALNLTRILCDTDAVPVDIQPAANPLTTEPLNLGFSSLRSFSPVHLEYLRNMGVRSSLTVSLMHNRRLWGLIACHGTTPREVPYHTRELAEFVGKTVSIKLANLEAAGKRTFQERVEQLLEDIARDGGDERSFEDALAARGADLLGLVDATGIMVCLNGRKHHYGVTPGAGQVEPLLNWIQQFAPAAEFHTDKLPELYPPLAPDKARFSGLLVAPLDERGVNCVAWFRPEIVQVVRWAGDPEKALVVREGRLSVSPRESFEAWLETYRGRSAPWGTAEVEAAEAVGVRIIGSFTEQALRGAIAQDVHFTGSGNSLRATLTGDCVFRSVSESCVRLLGFQPSEMQHRPLFDFLYVDDLEVVRRHVRMTLDGDDQGSFLFRHSRKDGSFVWLEGLLRPEFDAHGQPASMGFDARDVTELHQYQEILASLHERAELSSAIRHDGMAMLDLQGNIVAANAAAETLLGYPPGDLAGRNACGTLCEADPEHLFCTHQETFSAPAILARRGRMVRGDGSRLEARYYCIQVMSHHTGLARSMVLFREAEEDGPDADDEVVEAVMVTDRHGAIVAINEAFTAITGYAEDEVLGRTPALLRSHSHTQAHYRNFWAKISEEGFWKGEFWNRRKNGEIYPQWTTVYGIHEEHGGPLFYVSVFRDITRARRRNEEQTHQRANYDSMTGLPNRVALDERLQRAVSKAQRTGTRIAVAFLDFDHFKSINESLGHVSGDRFLYQAATRLSRAMRADDTLARWGGDEFIIVLENVGETAVVADFAARIVTELSASMSLGGREIIPAASIGLSMFPDDADNPEALIRTAETAMYRAKEKGRNCYEFFREEMSAAARERFELSTEMRRALRDEEFFLAFQPQVSASNHRTVGLEALARWRHPVRGVVPPAAFISVAEETGLIVELGDWVFRSTLRQIAEWKARGPFDVEVAINVAPQQLRPDFPDKIRGWIAEFGIPSHQIEVEITESALKPTPEIREVLAAIKDIGVLMAVDDFGTGYSSLAHICMFPIDRVKIDKSFVDGLPGNRNSAAIDRAIIAMSSALKLEVIAEGVETSEQLAFLVTEGVSTIQGYIFSRPLDPDDVPAFIAGDGTR